MAWHLRHRIDERSRIAARDIPDAPGALLLLAQGGTLATASPTVGSGRSESEGVAPQCRSCLRARHGARRRRAIVLRQWVHCPVGKWHSASLLLFRPRARTALPASRAGGARWRESAHGAGGREASRMPPQTRREARDRTTRVSRRWEGRRRARSLEDLRRAVAALEAHLVGSRGTVGSVVEVDEEVRVDLHAAVGRAVDPQ